MLIFFGFVGGYLVGYAGKDVLFTEDPTQAIHAGVKSSGPTTTTSSNVPLHPADKKWPGDTVHTLVTSSGDGYQNFQTRIMYATYKLAQKMPGGEKLTGFTRILHRTVPDILMEEVPTFHVWDVLKPQCDGWCDYPVANRPNAIMQFFAAAAANRSMIQGAWVLMIECDYIWMKPLQVPGNAWDPNVAGLQFHFDYIMPQHPNAAPHIQKLYGEGKNISDVPASGPAPVLLRLDDWLTITPDYELASARMEADAAMKKQLDWVREMYAWDVAVAMHPEIKVLTEKPPASALIVQPPFDVGMGNASMCHYTWGALYHDKGKQIYRWEKRDYTDMKHVIKVPKIPMPPPFRPGLRLEFDAELTEPRHNLVVLYLTQMNKAIDTLPELTERAKRLEDEIKEWQKNKGLRQLSKVMKQMSYVSWSPPGSPPMASNATTKAAAKARRLL